MTRHRFRPLADWSAKQSRVQRLARASSCDGDKSPAKSGDKSPRSKSLRLRRQPRQVYLCSSVVLFLICFSVHALEISWTNNLLTVTGANVPGGKLDVWYLEAFCRSGAHQREWGKTTLPHKTTLLANENNRVLRFRTLVETNVEVTHVVTAGADEIDFRFTFVNHGAGDIDLQWFQPACIRVEKFTGCGQSNYIARSFIFTDRGLTMLAAARRTEDALYRGGQAYVMPGVSTNDANPRPLSLDRPANGLIGCFSADGKKLLATASDATHELFEGVYVCLHSDPRVGGLKAGERKEIRAKLYVMTNDIPALLRRCEKDFPTAGK